MRAGAYPMYPWHKRQHDSCAATAARLHQRLACGDREAGLQLHNHISGWLRNHTRVTDRMMGAYLRNCDRLKLAS